MTSGEWESEVWRMGLWWSSGLRAWKQADLFLEWQGVPRELLADAIDSLRDEGREHAPPPAMVWKRCQELAPPLPELPPLENCTHDQALYAWGWEERSGGLVDAFCRFCGARRRLSRAQVVTPGEDELRRTEAGVV